ncbi:MAG: diadenylate cyclase CdaA [Duncaniella sp.]|nr:diadenylate cyclase CdaA [Duncaniella sp.]
MINIGIRDIFDIAIVALLLFYLYKIMKESGTINIFFGVLSFIVVWVVTSQILELKLIGTILDQFMGIGLLVLVILFQDQIKRFLVALGDHKRWHFMKKLFHHNLPAGHDRTRKEVLPIVYACMSMSKSRTGALIVIAREMPLERYEKSGDIIDADINTRLIENIFFKNSPLHDGAMIIDKGRIKAAGCILPVSHDRNVPRSLGLRHRSALGIAQATDAFAIVVSEETGNISVAYRGTLSTRLSSADLEQRLCQAMNVEEKQS